MPVLIYFQYNENCMQSSSKAQVQIKLLNYKQHLAIHAMSCSILSQKVQLPKNSASLPFSSSSELALPYTLQTVYVISRPSLEKTDKDIIKRLWSEYHENRYAKEMSTAVQFWQTISGHHHRGRWRRQFSAQIINNYKMLRLAIIKTYMDITVSEITVSYDTGHRLTHSKKGFENCL